MGCELLIFLENAVEAQIGMVGLIEVAKDRSIDVIDQNEEESFLRGQRFVGNVGGREDLGDCRGDLTWLVKRNEALLEEVQYGLYASIRAKPR